MARTILVWGPTGLATPTCKLMLRSAPLTLVETITLTEHGTIKRAYTGTVTASAGDYLYNLLTAGNFIGGGTIPVSGTDGTTSIEDGAVGILADGLITDAKFTVPTVSGVSTGILGMIVQVWRRFFRKATKSSADIKTFADDGSTVLTTQPVSDVGGTETQGTAT